MLLKYGFQRLARQSLKLAINFGISYLSLRLKSKGLREWMNHDIDELSVVLLPLLSLKFQESSDKHILSFLRFFPFALINCCAESSVQEVIKFLVGIYLRLQMPLWLSELDQTLVPHFCVLCYQLGWPRVQFAQIKKGFSIATHEVAIHLFIGLVYLALLDCRCYLF